MKSSAWLSALALGAALSFTAASAKATVVAGDVNSGGIGYGYYVTLGAGASDTVKAHVGAWSWEQNSNTSPNTGWTHTSTWYALSLTQATTFTLTIERDATVPWASGSDPDRKASTANMNPSFTLFSGWDNSSTATHEYANTTNIAWSSILSYVSHVNNNTAPSVTQTFTLPAGNYTIAIGSNADTDSVDRQGYAATFSTAAVPEPGSALLAVIGGLGVLARRKRRA